MKEHLVRRWAGSSSQRSSEPAFGLASALVLFVVVAVAWAPPAEGARCTARDDEAQAPWRQLTWQDFKYKLNTRASTDAVRTTTSIHFGRPQIVTEKEGEAWVARPSRICVYAELDKLRSGATPTGKNKRNLTHAQVRFDITEVFARRLYQELATLEERGPEPSAIAAELTRRSRELYRQTVSKWREAVTRHDEETDFGRKKLAQRRWQKQVSQWLEETPAIP